LQLQRDASILGALEGRFRRVPFRTHVARETGTGTGGAWVAEGASTPVAATAYDTLSQEAYKAQTIVALSNELLQLGNPAAERTVRQTVTAGVTAYLDAQLLTNTVTRWRAPGPRPSRTARRLSRPQARPPRR
jgi:HK97 family phage major capsid protein